MNDTHAESHTRRGEGSLLSKGKAGRVRLLSVAGTVLTVASGAFLLQVNQPDTAITSDWQVKMRRPLQTFLPEQWGFFTKSPREDALVPFRSASRGSHWTSAAAFPHARASNAFGWNRASRAQGIEIGLVTKVLAQQTWHDCGSWHSIRECLQNLSPARGATWDMVANPSPAPTLCGRIAIVRTAPIPWAWASAGHSAPRSRVAFAEVECTR